jgi:translation initiation factor IF-1
MFSSTHTKKHQRTTRIRDLSPCTTSDTSYAKVLKEQGSLHFQIEIIETKEKIHSVKAHLKGKKPPRILIGDVVKILRDTSTSTPKYYIIGKYLPAQVSDLRSRGEIKEARISESNIGTHVAFEGEIIYKDTGEEDLDATIDNI